MPRSFGSNSSRSNRLNRDHSRFVREFVLWEGHKIMRTLDEEQTPQATGPT
jgi:hypothetical protein